MKTCPYCGDKLADELPEEDDEALQEDAADEPGDAGMQGQLVPVVIVKNEDDLRAAAAVLTEYGIDFEIDEADGSWRRIVGVAAGRTAWRLLVKADEGPEAFLRLVKALPGLFPQEVTRVLEREREAHPDEAMRAAGRIVEILESQELQTMRPELATNIVAAFAGEDSAGIARAQYELARRGAEPGELLAEIAAQAVADGGDGAERVLYNVLEVLEALDDTGALGKIEALFECPTSQVRARAAYAAGRLGAPAAVDRLLELLADGDEEVRYEASEAIWRLTGLDFDFDPYLAVEKEKEHVDALRAAWEESGKKGRVRNRVSMASLLQALEGET